MGLILLGIWLVLTGLSGVGVLHVPGPAMPIIAIVAGILIVAGR